MKQGNFLFNESDTDESRYTTQSAAPIYEPKNKKPDPYELIEPTKTLKRLAEIEEADIPEADKRFLRFAAYRHTVFNYEAMADYYANSPKEVQELMEKSALVIVDIGSAIDNGFVRLCDKVKEQYLQDYGKDLDQ